MAAPEQEEEIDDQYTLEPQPENLERPQRTSEARVLTILAPEERKSNFKTYLVYPISAEPPIPGVVTVSRRYSDFKWLHDILCQQYPGMFIPPLPPKKLFGNFDEAFVEERRVDLERFLNRLEQIPALSENLCFTMFLRRPEASFKDGCKEVMDGIDDSILFKTQTLQTLFPDLHAEELHEEAEQDLVRIKEFFDKTKAQLNTVHQCSIDVLQSYSSAKNESLLLHNNLSELYHVEQNYPYRDSPSRLNVADEFQQWANFHTKQERYFKRHILRNIRYELQDVEAILNELQRVTDIQNQYNKAHSKAESWRNYEKELSAKEEVKKNEQLEAESQLKELLDIAIKIVLLNDVENIWRNKIEAFKRDMYEYSNKALQYYNEIADVWNNIEEPANMLGS